MDIEKDILDVENHALKQENERLLCELDIMNSLFNSKFSNSIVGNLRLKSKNGYMVWIDITTIDINELLSLDPDEEINSLILRKQKI